MNVRVEVRSVTYRVLALVMAFLLAISTVFITSQEAHAGVDGEVETSMGAQGYNINNDWDELSGTHLFSVTTAAGSTHAYCVEAFTPIMTTEENPNANATLQPWSEYPQDNLYKDNPIVQKRVNWIVANSYPSVSLEKLSAKLGIEEGGLTEMSAITQTQAALWYLTDGFNYERLATTPDGQSPGMLESRYEKHLFEYLLDKSHAGLDESQDQISEVELVKESSEVRNISGTDYVGPVVFETSDDTDYQLHAAVDVFDEKAATVNPAAVPSGTKLFFERDDVAPSVEVTAVANNEENGRLVVTEINDPSTGQTGHRQTFLTSHTSESTSSASVTVDDTPTPDTTESTTPETTPTPDTTPTTEPTTPGGTPEIDTTATDAADGDKIIGVGGGEVVDRVDYRGLIPGKEYRLEGELKLKTKEGAKDTGITAETTFVAEEADGSVELTFTVPAGYFGKSLVAFEKLFETDASTKDGQEAVATHEDINDKDQTVTVDRRIGTLAKDQSDDDKIITPEADSTVVDIVEYVGLVPGTEYTLTGTLMDKATGESTGITGSTTFTPEAANGTTELEFLVDKDTAMKYKGKELVAFEVVGIIATEGEDDFGGLEKREITDANGQTQTVVVVATHEDIDSEAQTIGVGTPDEFPWLLIIPLIPIIGDIILDGDEGSSTQPEPTEYNGEVPNPTTAPSSVPVPEEENTEKIPGKTPGKTPEKDERRLATTGASVLGISVVALVVLLAGIALMRTRSREEG